MGKTINMSGKYTVWIPPMQWERNTEPRTRRVLHLAGDLPVFLQVARSEPKRAAGTQRRSCCGKLVFWSRRRQIESGDLCSVPLVRDGFLWIPLGEAPNLTTP